MVKALIGFNMKRRSTYVWVVAIFCACSCGNVREVQPVENVVYDDRKTEEEYEAKQFAPFDELEYRYQDASVPPEYHRSYSIIISDGKLRYTVDSYGDVIGDTTISIDKAKWEKVQGFFSKAISNRKRTELKPGCTGGTGESITTRLAGNVVFNGANYYCAGQTDGDLEGDIDGLLEIIKEGVSPNVFLR
jgi:hypothetical protein